MDKGETMDKDKKTKKNNQTIILIVGIVFAVILSGQSLFFSHPGNESEDEIVLSEVVELGGDWLSIFLLRGSPVIDDVVQLSSAVQAAWEEAGQLYGKDGKLSSLDYVNPRVILPVVFALAGEDYLKALKLDRAQLTEEIRKEPGKFWRIAPGSYTHLQLLLFNKEQLNECSDEAISEYLRDLNVIENGEMVDRVNRIAEKVYNAIPEQQRDDFSAHKVYVIDSEEINACCFPNGDIFVNSGMIDFAENDDELALIIGHEYAHFTMQHTNERLSKMILFVAAENLLRIRQEEKNSDMEEIQRALKQFALKGGYDLASFASLRAFSRSNENEADRNGLYYMNDAGYNPHKGVLMWKRMMEQKGKMSKLAAFISTHPADDKRFGDLTKLCRIIEMKKLLKSDVGDKNYTLRDTLPNLFSRHAVQPENFTSIAEQTKNAWQESVQLYGKDGELGILDYVNPKVVLPPILAMVGDDELKSLKLDRNAFAEDIRKDSGRYWRRAPGSLLHFQLLLFSKEQLKNIGDEMESSIVKRSIIVEDDASATRVKSIADKLLNAVPEEKRGDFHELKTCVVQSPMINACCLPNGTIVVSSGLLAFVRNDDELALVLAHEMAHLNMQHINETLSKLLLFIAADNMQRMDIDNTYPELTSLQNALKQFTAMTGYNISEKSDGVAYGSSAENEADSASLEHMAKAGFNPRAGIAFWNSLPEQSDESILKLMKYFAIHPADEKRLESLAKLCDKIAPVKEETDSNLAE